MTGLAQDHTVGQLYMASNDLSLENHGEDWLECLAVNWMARGTCASLSRPGLAWAHWVTVAISLLLNLV